LQITEDRRERVIDLYFNQHKTYAEIAGIERMSPRDINVIVKEEDARRQKYQNQQQQEMISSKAYKLFSEGKRPVEVAIALNLRELEATKYYREYWKLKQLHRLNSLYEEIGDDIRHIVFVCFIFFIIFHPFLYVLVIKTNRNTFIIKFFY
jgi:predicted HTH domain antitoxin